MDKVVGRLTVFFEQPFWVGVFECISEGKLSVCKVTFGAEPKDYEVYDFVLIRREVRKQVQNTGIGTKSQQALKLQQEQSKTEHKTMSREQREAEKQRQFELKQQKRKKKHRGR